jgi:hypothetical protein
VRRFPRNGFGIGDSSAGLNGILDFIQEATGLRSITYLADELSLEYLIVR